jgi:valyl-tRNA synthetase
MSEPLKPYEPHEIEPRWYQFWVDQGVFRASSAANDARPTYVVPMPPPNVTGSLHMGHALTGTIEDVLVRYHRMCGHNTLWQPGLDHAGIATQAVVERQLRREGKSRHDLGREKFVERVWTWKGESGGRILEQMRVLGVSADWERLKFTMDPDLSVAVKEAFVRLHEEGLIYRATRLINWCSDCRTALSDLEVENQENNGEMYEFAYLVKDAPAGSVSELVVATTRPETMLGDTAVAVHPDDPRYKHLHGKLLKHPFLDREIPVITDAVLVDMAFGTGAVKVTPAHDFNDFATGKRHKLQEINILNLDGTLNAEAGQFQGKTVAEGRKAVKRALAELGLERGTKQHKLQIPRCDRCNTIVEPMISTQWFVKMEPLAKPALAAVKDGRTQILPEEWVKTYDHWLSNIQDWCISRQLWWGHRIPAFHCSDCSHITVTREETLSHCPKCQSKNVAQDSDVLDTWFSSGLWPFSTLGWPKETLELKRFYPASDMETGYDILFFWVARMMMMGLHFMGEVPFKRILLHGLVVDENGDKMSKVKGNTIDPLDLIRGATFDEVVGKALPGAPLQEALPKFKKSYPSTAQMGAGFPAYGADALRFTLCSYSPQARRIALSPKRIEGYRHFCNKIYNAVRYALGHLDGVTLSAATPAPKLLMNRWILSRLSRAVITSRTGIEQFRLDEGSGALYHFFWYELCDWFLELSKVVFASGTAEEQAETRLTLAHAIETALRALHPYVPFVSEELWQRVPRPTNGAVSVALAKYPSDQDGRLDDQAEQDMNRLMAVITAARTIRSEHEVHPGGSVPLWLRTNSDAARQLLQREQAAIKALVKTEGEPAIESLGAERPKGAVLSVVGDVEVLVGLRGLVDPAHEQERIDRELKKINKDIEGLEKRLNTPSFIDKAPPEVVTQAKADLAALKEKKLRLEEARSLVSELS